jgi:hypothetical protein
MAWKAVANAVDPETGSLRVGEGNQTMNHAAKKISACYRRLT